MHVISGHSVFLVCAAGRNAPTSSLGVEVPVYASSAGKVLVSQMSEANWSAYAPDADSVAFTDKTVLSPSEFIKQLQRAKEEGVAWNDGEHSKTTCSVAAPIPDSEKLPERSVALVFSSSEWMLQNRSELIAEVKKIAAKLSGKLRGPF